MPHHGRSMWDEQTDDFTVAFNNSSREECSQWKLSNLSWLEIYSSRYWPVRGKIKLCETCWESLLSWSGIDHILYVINPHTSHCDIIIYKPLRHGRMSRYYRQEYFNKVKMEFHSQLVRGWIPSQACVLERWWYDGTRERERVLILKYSVMRIRLQLPPSSGTGSGGREQEVSGDVDTILSLGTPSQ